MNGTIEQLPLSSAGKKVNRAPLGAGVLSGIKAISLAVVTAATVGTFLIASAGRGYGFTAPSAEIFDQPWSPALYGIDAGPSPNNCGIGFVLGNLYTIRSYCQIWCLSVFGHAAIWPVSVASIPFLNVTPVMTLAR
jgi:hypothetical protein